MALAPGARRLRFPNDMSRVRASCSVSAQVVGQVWRCSQAMRWVNFTRRNQNGCLSSENVCRLVSPLSARSRLRDFAGARRRLALLLRLRRPAGYGFRSKSCSQSTAKRFLRTLRECRPSALGAGPSLASQGVTRAGRGNSTKRRQDHEQSQPHRIVPKILTLGSAA